MAVWQPGAIGFAVAVQLVLLFGALFFPPYGAVALGIAGGLTAGALAGGGYRPGARHGLVAGAIGAMVVVVVGLVMALTAGLGAAPIPGLGVAESQRLPFLLAGAILVPFLAAAAGALGGELRGTREFPGRLEHERR